MLGNREEVVTAPAGERRDPSFFPADDERDRPGGKSGLIDALGRLPGQPDRRDPERRKRRQRVRYTPYDAEVEVLQGARGGLRDGRGEVGRTVPCEDYSGDAGALRAA